MDAATGHGQPIPGLGGARSKGTGAAIVFAALAGIAYFAASMGTYALFDANDLGLAFWPGAGISLGALLLTRRRDWPYVLVAIGVFEFVADWIQDAPLTTALAWAGANCLEAGLGAYAITWAFRGGPITFNRTRDAIRFLVVAAAAGPPLATLFGSLATVESYGGALLPAWRRWYVGDLIGILVIAPLLISLPRLRRGLDRGFAVELLLVAAVSLLVFGPFETTLQLDKRFYLLLPVLVLVGLRRGPLGAAPAVAIAVLISNVATGLGHGPFAPAVAGPDSLVDLQIFNFAELFTVWLFTALAADLGHTRRTLDTLESSFWHLQRDQELLPICMGCSRVRTSEGAWESLKAFFHDRTDFLSHGYCPDCAAAARREANLPAHPLVRT